MLTQVQCSVAKGNSSTVTADFDLLVRSLGGVFRPKGLEIAVRAGGSQSQIIDFRPYLIIPKNSDIELTCLSNTNDTSASGYFAGMLASVAA